MLLIILIETFGIELVENGTEGEVVPDGGLDTGQPVVGAIDEQSPLQAGAMRVEMGAGGAGAGAGEGEAEESEEKGEEEGESGDA